jgi:hypothetical protein
MAIPIPDANAETSYHLIELFFLAVIAFAKAFEKLVDKLVGRVPPIEEIRLQVKDLRHEFRNFMIGWPKQLDATYVRQKEHDLEVKRIDQRIKDLSGTS